MHNVYEFVNFGLRNIIPDFQAEYHFSESAHKIQGQRLPCWAAIHCVWLSNQRTRKPVIVVHYSNDWQFQFQSFGFAYGCWGLIPHRGQKLIFWVIYFTGLMSIWLVLVWSIVHLLNPLCLSPVGFKCVPEAFGGLLSGRLLWG